MDVIPPRKSCPPRTFRRRFVPPHFDTWKEVTLYLANKKGVDNSLQSILILQDALVTFSAHLYTNRGGELEPNVAYYFPFFLWSSALYLLAFIAPRIDLGSHNCQQRTVAQSEPYVRYDIHIIIPVIIVVLFALNCYSYTIVMDI